MKAIIKSGRSTLLRIDADPQVQGSVARYLADTFLDFFLQINPQTEVVLRDLAISPQCGMDSEEHDEPKVVSSEGERLTDIFCEELDNAHRILITTTIENMSVPHELKNYMDLVARNYQNYRRKIGKNSFLNEKRRLLVITTSQTIFQRGIDRKNDFLSPYLSAIFNGMGFSDIHFVNAAGLSLGEQEKEDSILRAKAELMDLAREWK